MANPIDTTYNDAYTLAKYNNGVTNDGYSAKDALVSTGAVVGGYSIFKGGTWAWQNRKDYKTGWQNVKAGYANAKTLKGANLKETYLNNYRTNYISDLEKRFQAPKTLTAAEQAKLSPSKLAAYNRQQAISAEYNHVRQLIQDSKSLRGQDLLNKKREINQAIADAKLSVAQKTSTGGPLAATSKFGKAMQWLKKKTGITQAELAIKKAAANGNKYARIFTKAPKGTPATAAVALALESGTIYNSYKKLGAAKGTKQLLKSSAIAGAGILGYAAGSAALGAAVGSVVPIAGTAIGTVVGLAGGLIGGWLADSAARKLLPSELDLDARKKADEAAKNPEKMKELLKETEEKAADETDEKTLATLQASYDKLSEQVAPAATSAEGDAKDTPKAEGKETPAASKKDNINALKKTLEKFQELLKNGWNCFNQQDVYNALKPYEKPTYQSFMNTPYGWAA